MSELSVVIEDVPGALYLSASGITRLTSCEMKWVQQNAMPSEERDKIAKSEALDLGTLVHALKRSWWQGVPWRSTWVTLLHEVVEDAGYELCKDGSIGEKKGWEAPSHFLRARKIMEAWEEVHGATVAQDPDLPQGTEIVATELPFDLPVPGVSGARIRGFLDGVASIPVDGNRTHNRYKVVEEKTMGKWGREVQVPWDPQLHLYGWAARSMFPVDGAIFEAISTYDYKTGGPERRFKRIPLDFDDRMIARTVEDLQRVARRAKALVKNPKLAVRNVGDACSYCEFHRQCLTPWEEA